MDFLTRPLEPLPHLALGGEAKTVLLARPLARKTRFGVGAAAGSYAVPDDLTFLRGAPDATGVSLFARAEHDFGAVALGATLGMLSEKNALLGSLALGAFGVGEEASTVFSGASAVFRLGHGFSLRAQYETGWTSVAGRAPAFFEAFSTFRTSSFAAVLTKEGVFGPHDRLGLSVAQPLRVENGILALSLPTGRDYDLDRILFSETSAPLSPSSREINLEISYRVVMTSGFRFEVNLVRQFHPGHTLGRDHADAFLVRLSRGF